MKILHYLYGMPPHRSGGLIKYALDLAQEQRRCGQDVVLLTAGTIFGRNSSKVHIRKGRAYVSKTGKGDKISLPVFHIQNPLPIPYSLGIRDIEWYTSGAGRQAYEAFLKKEMPDVIHVHSLMGIHKSFFEAAKSLGIRMVYTSHDYFGLCPCTLLLKDNKSCHDHSWSGCGECCRQAFGTFHLIVDQSPLYQTLFSNKLFQGFMKFLMKCKAVVLRGKKKNASSIKPDNKLEASTINSQNGKAAQSEASTINSQNNKDVHSDPGMDYEALRIYYQDIFAMMDYFHYNSDVSKNVFEEWLDAPAGRTVPILNKECGDFRKIRKYDPEAPLRVGFLGSLAPGKGYAIASRVVKKLKKDGYNLYLNIYFDPMVRDRGHLKVNPPYRYEEIHRIFNENDLIVVPSIWKETFGLVTVEALSHGLPVIASEHVGSSLLIKDGQTGRIIKGNLNQALYRELKNLCEDRDILLRWNKNIMKADYDFSFPHHAKIIMEKIYLAEDDSHSH